jgi:tellurite resistance protein TerC
MHEPLWMWLLFFGVVFTLLVLDLGVFHKRQHAIGIKESLLMSGFYILMAFIFGGWMWHQLGSQSAAEYFTAYLVEKSLSMDNIFLISVIFSFFAIPLKYQHRVLFWGILGVVILRGIMIGLGAELVERFEWVLYIFAAFLIFTGIKMFFLKEKDTNLSDNPVLKWMSKHLRVTPDFHDKRFFVRLTDEKTNRRKLFLTPLFTALVLIELTDIVFAVDSIPAVFTITTDPYIVYTSNIFAILGLRALYFALAVIIDRFHYLKYALAAVLIFIGSKMFIADLLDTKIPAPVSLGITFGLLAAGCVYSLYKSRKSIA